MDSYGFNGCKLKTFMKHAFEYLSYLPEAWEDVAWSLLETRRPRSTALCWWHHLDLFSLVRFGTGRGGRQALL